MAALSAYGRKAALDWLLGGATPPTPPAFLYLGLATGQPSSTSASEISAVVGTYTRSPVIFSAAVSPGGSAINSAAVSYPANSYTGTLTGWQLWDTQPVGSGNFWWYGSLSAATRPSSLSGFTFGAGSILLTVH